MTNCCPHEENEHAHETICLDQIHFPSEDYPCLCDGISGEGAKCENCGHKRETHLHKRVCRPKSGESCNCSTPA
jgi:hypothetical protein